MQLVVLGLNHRTAPVNIRECFSFPEERVKWSLKRIKGYDRWLEAVILSTCNRTELYAVLENPEVELRFIKRVLAYLSGKDYSEEHFYIYEGEDCIRHLFNVASSLDSLVLGEGQILSQVKNAYNIARNLGLTGTLLNTVFNKAIAVGKRVRTETKIAYNSVSVASAAVDLAGEIMGDLSLANVLVVGAGAMSELTAKHLIETGVSTIFVSNRNHERAKSLAERFHGVAIPFEEFMTLSVNADIIITSTGAPHYIITLHDMAHVLKERAGRPLVIIDIAMPRDVEPEVGALNGVTLYNIDDLEAVVDANRELRENEAHVARAIIEDEVVVLLERFAYLSMRPVMSKLQDKMEFLRDKLLKRSMSKLGNLTDTEKRVVEQLTKTLVRKMLREPMRAMNNVAGTAQETEYKDFITKVYLLNQDEEDEDEKETYDWD